MPCSPRAPEALRVPNDRFGTRLVSSSVSGMTVLRQRMSFENIQSLCGQQLLCLFRRAFVTPSGSVSLVRFRFGRNYWISLRVRWLDLGCIVGFVCQSVRATASALRIVLERIARWKSPPACRRTRAHARATVRMSAIFLPPAALSSAQTRASVHHLPLPPGRLAP